VLIEVEHCPCAVSILKIRFFAIALFPGQFPVLAGIFAALCFATGALRLFGAYRAFDSKD